MFTLNRFDPYPVPFAALTPTEQPISSEFIEITTCTDNNNNDVGENRDPPPYKLSLTVDELLSPSRSHRLSKKPNRGPPRPQNPWILFRKDFEAKLRDGHGLHAKSVNANEISCLAGAEWKKVSPDVKQYFRLLAKTALERHRIMYPNYKYAPKRRGRKNEEETLVLTGPKFQHLRPIQPSPFPPSSAVTIAPAAPRCPPPDEVHQPDSPLTDSPLTDSPLTDSPLTPVSPPLTSLPPAPLTPPAHNDEDNDDGGYMTPQCEQYSNEIVEVVDPFSLLQYADFEDRLYANPFVMDATDAVYTTVGLGDPTFLNQETTTLLQTYGEFCEYPQFR